jgi:F-type H+-transporting ATPase subunit epsilon
MEQNFLLQITTPTQVFFDGFAEALTIQTPQGSFGILANIMPIVTILAQGSLQVKMRGKWMQAIAGQGFLKMRNNIITILCDNIVWEHEINQDETQEYDEDSEMQKRMQSIREHHRTRSQMIKKLSRKNDDD